MFAVCMDISSQINVSLCPSVDESDHFVFLNCWEGVDEQKQ